MHVWETTISNREILSLKRWLWRGEKKEGTNTVGAKDGKHLSKRQNGKNWNWSLVFPFRDQRLNRESNPFIIHQKHFRQGYSSSINIEHDIESDSNCQHVITEEWSLIFSLKFKDQTDERMTPYMNAALRGEIIPKKQQTEEIWEGYGRRRLL